jgi:hypothetical protein
MGIYGYIGKKVRAVKIEMTEKARAYALTIDKPVIIRYEKKG